MTLFQWAGVAFTLLIFGMLILLQLPTRWQTWSVYLSLSLVGIPLFLLAIGAMVAYPALFVLLLLVAFAGANPRR